jgi:hypothetical protein
MQSLGKAARITFVFCLIALGLLGAASMASARDYEAEITNAQSRVATASDEVVDLRTSVAPARAHLAAVEKKAAPTQRQARVTAAHVTAIKRDVATHRRHAAGTAAQVHDENQSAAQKHDRKVHTDIGFALAALVIAAIAFAWGWFRASAAVAYLTRIPLKNVILAIIGVAVVTLLVGGGLSRAGGLPAVFGGLTIGLSVALPVALLLARHSAEIQRGRAKAIFGRERMSGTVTKVVAGLFGLIFLVTLLTGFTEGEARSRQVPAQVQVQMKLASDSGPRIKSGEDRAATLRKELAPLQKAIGERRSNLHIAEHKLRRAQTHLVDAKNDERRWSRELAEAQAKEQRKLEREEERATRQQEREEREYERALEKEEREAEKASAEEAEADACDPNYVGACLHEGIGDYDCAGGSGDGPNYVEGPIEVVGVDEFGLDEDGDGIACEDG